jgi:HEAT repeat protein
LHAIETAARRGSTREDLTHGHPLAADPDAREIQERFLEFAAKRLVEIRDVLRNSGDEEQRAIAAGIIGYAPNKKGVINDLEYAVQDPDEGVRSSAMRALNAIAVLAVKQPELDIHISPTWFVEMLNSIVLSDRTRATNALITLTDTRPPDTLALLRERALPSLVEMAQWNSLRYALPAFILVGRIGGLSEQMIQDSWTKGQRAAVILDVVGSRTKKRR